MRAKLLVVPVMMFGLMVGLGAMPAEGSAARATSRVTITAQGTDLSGRVISDHPGVCANNRHVIVMKQIGTRGGGDDTQFASDNASLSAGAYRWETGNTGTPGFFYAKIRPIPGSCPGDTSRTIHAVRNP